MQQPTIMCMCVCLILCILCVCVCVYLQTTTHIPGTITRDNYPYSNYLPPPLKALLTGTDWKDGLTGKMD